MGVVGRLFGRHMGFLEGALDVHKTTWRYFPIILVDKLGGIGGAEV